MILRCLGSGVGPSSPVKGQPCGLKGQHSVPSLPSALESEPKASIRSRANIWCWACLRRWNQSPELQFAQGPTFGAEFAFGAGIRAQRFNLLCLPSALESEPRASVRSASTSAIFFLPHPFSLWLQYKFEPKAEAYAWTPKTLKLPYEGSN